MAREADNRKQELLEQVEAIVTGGRDDIPAKQAAYYTRNFFKRVPIEDLGNATPDELAAVVASQMGFVRKRLPGQSLVDVFNPSLDEDGWESQHTVIELANEDKPFLVNTANMAVAELNLGVHLMVHPVMHVERDAGGEVVGYFAPEVGRGQPESIIHMQVDRQNDPEALSRIKAKLEGAMRDVSVAVEDWRSILEKASEAIRELPDWAAVVSPERVEETRDFLGWMCDNHFLFLGMRDYEVKHDEGQSCLAVVEGSGLGLLRESERTVMRRPLTTLSESARLNQDDPLIITKTRSRSTVHRVGYMDYIGVLRFDAEGNTVGERRFIGLFTSNAYFRRALDTPLLRRKINDVLERSGVSSGSHAYKALVHILETLPRDDVFQATVEELTDIAMAVLNLQERRMVRLLVRQERFSRFYSCLVFLPRDQSNTENRENIQRILFNAYQGERIDYNISVSDSLLARLKFVIRPKAGCEPQPDVRQLEQKIVDTVRSWTDALRDILVQKHGEDTGLRWAADIGEAFPAAYVEDVSPWVASFDVQRIAELDGSDDLGMSLYRPRRRDTDIIRFKVFRYDQPIPLSDVLPMLENLGLRIVSERPYDLTLPDGRMVWVQDFDMVFARGDRLDLEQVRDRFQEAFEFILRGVTVSDGFNRLILAASLGWRQVKVLRAYCKYLLQTGIPFSLNYMSETLSRHPLLARLLVQMFEGLFNPDWDTRSESNRERNEKRLRRDFEMLYGDETATDPVLSEYLEDVLHTLEGERDRHVFAVKRAFTRGLAAVASLDEDRILQAFCGLMEATLRTNYFQLGPQNSLPEYLSFKLDSAQVPDLPRPRPYREIWVYSSRVEGIHLRMGKVARGGLRWSDRKEDFRTEVLGLMKAQNVKNTMIVPVGAKGGFVVQRPPEGGDREALMREVTHCYVSFINGLLDITDNLEESTILPPERVVRRDEDDPYLVVAADKGTATFSDTANSVAIEHEFWLGDAFASGGSVGYDHKGMGITARGAWEGVKRHFLEMGKDIQNEPFSVVGIGDMAGDVFGNGMLLSRHIRLMAAFNHMHIFLDPDPDTERSFEERERLFKLPRSSWEDYDASLISEGGGVFSRAAKTIPLSPQVREWLGVDDEWLAPHDLIRNILCAEVELLWNGGIGTYVRASSESDAEVGDLANNALRVTGDALRCRVVGEGGNLGMTQLGRIEFARAGGRLNTDFIDNSAGVDCSDHEVNIKILLNQAMRSGAIDAEQREKLLARMTDEVSELVLRSNYLQTQALSMMERLSGPRIGAKQHFISVLESEGQIDRELEGLPDDEELHDRRQRGLGLTRPELSVLLSYSKIRLYRQLLDSDVPEDPYLSRELRDYFPTPLREEFAQFMPEHRLKREIIATQVTNSLVNRMGVSFVMRMREDTSATPGEVARAYTIGRELVDARAFWAQLEGLDARVDAEMQTRARLVMWNLLRRITRWIAAHPGHDLDIQCILDQLKPGMAIMREHFHSLMSAQEQAAIEHRAAEYLEAGFPRELALRIAELPELANVLDIVETAAQRELDVRRVATVFFSLGNTLGLRWIGRQVEGLPAQGQWQAQARGNLRQELFEHQRALAAQVLDQYMDEPDAVKSWSDRHGFDVERFGELVESMRALPAMDYATLSVAVRSLAQLLSSAERNPA